MKERRSLTRFMKSTLKGYLGVVVDVPSTITRESDSSLGCPTEMVLTQVPVSIVDFGPLRGVSDVGFEGRARGSTVVSFHRVSSFLGVLVSYQWSQSRCPLDPRSSELEGFTLESVR